MSYTPLNPEAPVSKGCKHPLSASHGESTEDGLLERHLDLSQRDVSYMVEVQRLQQLQNQQLHALLKQQQLQTLAITLAQPEIPVFSGDPVKYSDFAPAFENLIETKREQSELEVVLSRSIYIRRSERINAKLLIDGS